MSLIFPLRKATFQHHMHVAYIFFIWYFALGLVKIAESYWCRVVADKKTNKPRISHGEIKAMPLISVTIMNWYEISISQMSTDISSNTILYRLWCSFIVVTPVVTNHRFCLQSNTTRAIYMQELILEPFYRVRVQVFVSL